MRSAAYRLAPMTFLACFLIETGTTSPGVAPLTMGWAPPHQSLRKCPTGLRIAQSYRDILIEVPSSQMMLACVKLTKL